MDDVLLEFEAIFCSLRNSCISIKNSTSCINIRSFNKQLDKAVSLSELSESMALRGHACWPLQASNFVPPDSRTNCEITSYSRSICSEIEGTSRNWLATDKNIAKPFALSFAGISKIVHILFDRFENFSVVGSAHYFKSFLRSGMLYQNRLLNHIISRQSESWSRNYFLD